MFGVASSTLFHATDGIEATIMKHGNWKWRRQVTLTFSLLCRRTWATFCSLFTQSGTLKSPEIKSLSRSSASFICPGSLEASMPANIVPGGRDNAALRFTQLVRSGCWGRTDVWRALCVWVCVCDQCICVLAFLQIHANFFLLCMCLFQCTFVSNYLPRLCIYMCLQCSGVCVCEGVCVCVKVYEWVWAVYIQAVFLHWVDHSAAPGFVSREVAAQSNILHKLSTTDITVHSFASLVCSTDL